MELLKMKLPQVLGFVLISLLLFSLTRSPLAGWAAGFNQANYVVSHLSIELLSIFIFTSCVIIVLQPLHRQHHFYTNTVIFGFTTVALLDYVHALSYAGMPTFITPSSTPKAIFFWLFARSIELLTFLLLVSRIRLPGGKFIWLLLSLLVSSLVTWLGTMHLSWFPVLFEPGLGVSAFKQQYEYGLFVGNSLLMVLFYFRYLRSQRAQYLLFAGSAFCMALCSLSLTDYIEASDISLLIGHLFKLVSALLIYKGIFWSELKKPYERLHAAEMRSARNERELETILSNLPVGVVRLDQDYRYSYLNKTMRALSERMQRAEPGDAMTDHMPPELADIYQVQLATVFGGETTEFSYSVVSVSGKTKHRMVKAVPELTESGAVASALCLVSDVTARVEAEQAKYLAEKEMLELRTALDEHAIVAFTDAKGVITSVNDKFCAISGYSRDELLGKTHRIINSGFHEPGFFKAMWQALKSGSIWHGEVCNRAKNGSLYWVNTTIVPFINDEGRIVQYIAIRADITERKMAEQEAKRLALFDDLTGLPNRRALKEQISRLCLPEKAPLYHAMLMLDLDNFKDINDSFGHSVGDDLLKQVAHRIQRFTVSSEHCARLGGDEFVVLLAEIGTSPDICTTVLLHSAEQICQALAQPYQLHGKIIRTSASVGISMFNCHVQDVTEVLKQADIALYQSKASGRNCVTFFDPVLQQAMDKRNQILRELKTAIEQRELVLHYQPIFNAAQQITGVEALLRWHNAALGMVSPAVFIPLAEESNLILDIGEWVLQTACQQLAEWHSHPVCRHWLMAVNVSAKQLQRDNFVSTVLEIIHTHAIPADKLQLEITETMLQGEIENTAAKMAALKSQGIRFSLDDFGTGYSSLNYLTKLPINTLKIDRSFVDSMLGSREDASVVQTILSLANSLHLDVVAEGVETMAQADFLRQLGCPKFQGYLFARPMSPAQLASLIQAPDTIDTAVK